MQVKVNGDYMTKFSELKSVKKLIADVERKCEIAGIQIGDTFRTCFTNTPETALTLREDGTVFVITGDIPAMWLRDSACQVRPYLVLAREEETVADMIEGVIRSQIQCIQIDPYANAFNETANGNCWEHDLTDMKPELWERKFEIDSLCYPIQLAYLYWKNSGKTTHFDSDFLNAAKTIVRVFRTEQDHEHKSPYSFQRMNCIYTDTLSRNGKGALVNEKAGLIWSGFRPSDDACVYGYLIPSNMFAAVILEYLSEISEVIYNDKNFAAETASFAKELREAIAKEAVVPGGDKLEPFYAYEVDGFGQYLVMDDANVPSLLSIPYIGYEDEESLLYQNTRNKMLSEVNPYYYKGRVIQGIGSIHTPHNYIWHIAVGMEGLTSKEASVKKEVIQRLLSSDGGKGCMHESVNADDDKRYTRSWFGWANAIFCELVLEYCGYGVKR